MSENATGQPENATDDEGTNALSYVVLAGLYLATVLGGLSLADEASAMGLVAFQNPGDVGNVGVFAVYVLVFTAIMVAAFRTGRGEQLIRLVFLLLVGGLVGTAFVLLTGVGTVATGHSLLAGMPSSPLPVALGLGVAGLLWIHPEWYVIDPVGVALGAVAIPLFGLSFGPLPIVVLLVVWAGYDALSVYGSGHMQDLAGGAISLRLPIFFVVPTRRGFSMRRLDEEASPVSDEEDGSDHEFGAMLLGLGDAIIPGMLAVSAGHFLDAPAIVPSLNANAPAVGALLGGVVGLVVLLALVHRTDSAHAGLPPLNAGVLGGYLLGAAVAGISLTTAIGL